MCTAVTYKGAHHFFGRNLDVECGFGESVIIIPRSFIFPCDNYICSQGDKRNVLRSLREPHYAMVVMGIIDNGYPLIYDGMNEKGLGIAGLNFVGNTHYYTPRGEGTDIAQYQIMPLILASCKNVGEAVKLFRAINPVDRPFRENMPTAQLHYIVADKKDCITVEFTETGVKIYENSPGVLTNNPPFDYHMKNLSNYMGLSADSPVNNFSGQIKLSHYSNGMGALGLPGDFSSASRFIKAVFVKHNSSTPPDEVGAVNQFFHILSSVEQVEGCVRTDAGYEKTVYSSCCNLDTGTYYYKTYNDFSIRSVSMTSIDLDSCRLKPYPT